MIRVLAGTAALMALAAAAGVVDSRLRHIQVALAPNAPLGSTVQAPAATATAPARPVAPAATTGPDASAPATQDGSSATAAAAAAFDPATLVAKQRITLEEAHYLWTLGDPFVDARTRARFEAGHIAGAFHLPAAQFDINAPALQVLDPQGRVVIYCTGGECDDSESVAIRLQQLGFTQLLIMEAGYDDWASAGYPTAQGPPDGEPW